MKKTEPIVNRVASSGLITFDLEDYYQPGDRIVLDIKGQLYEGMMLREKNFREFISTHNWQQYHGKFVAITCSADAIIPLWAYMLLSVALQPYARIIEFGTLDQLERRIFLERLSTVDWNSFKNSKIVIKGCSKYNIPISVYIYVCIKLRPLVTSLMFGEPCSTVPLFKSLSK